VIQPAGPEHAAALALIHAEAFPPGARWIASTMAVQLGLPGVLGFVDQRGGFVLARVAADEAEVLTLAVEPGARRLGLGRALMQAAMAAVTARGAASMALEVAERNAAARALYAGLGFVAVGRRRGYYGAGGDALILWLALG
jgi:ribosomal-protein-alanine N-acetyltransferase